MEQIVRIQRKIARILEDPQCADYLQQHYAQAGPLFNPPLTEIQLVEFEQAHAIQLPSGYREFLRLIGNGGAGPYNGILPLERAPRWYVLEQVPDYLARPFPLRTSAYLGDDDDSLEPLPYLEYAYGTLDICHFGCGILFVLVVSGPEAGSVWVNDLAHDQGVFALTQTLEGDERVDFLTFYENWLAWIADGPDPRYEEFGYFAYGFRRE